MIDMFLQLIHRIIDSVDKKQNPPPGAGGSLSIRCKDFCIIGIDFQNTEELNNVALSLESLSSVGKIIYILIMKKFK